MSDGVLKITPTDAPPPPTPGSDADRFSRLGLIGWWDQDRLAAARVVVVGAGALGNEIIKNLALLGVGHVLVIDLDRIEHSNLSRSVLYRAADAGSYKAHVAARAAREIYPGCQAHGLVGDVRLDLGLGAFRRADVVLGGLDNREARLAINRACYKVGTPWIDGAIERIDGVAKVFTPPGPCYECTLGAADWEVMRHRKSCAGLTREQMEGGATPTTPTVSSIIAAVQVQEAVKLLHGLPTLTGRGWTFNGDSTEAWQVEYPPNPDCLSHDPLAEVRPAPTDATLADVTHLAAAETLELPKPLVVSLSCPTCRQVEPVADLLERLPVDRLACPDCGKPRRPDVLDTIDRGHDLAGRRARDLGYPELEIFAARTDRGLIGYELSGDPPTPPPTPHEDRDASDLDDLGLEVE